MAERLNRLELLVTRRCTSRCRHCCFEVRTKGPDMAAEEAARWITEGAAGGSLGSVLLFGGEPMLNPETVLTGVRVATRLGVPRVDIITNAYWAETEEAARGWVERLHGAGLRRMVISVDAFHAEFTPMERPRLAGRAARAAGMQVTWNVCVLQEGRAGHPMDEKTWQIVDGLRGISPEVNMNVALPLGRALQSFAARYPRRPGIPRGPCPGPSYGAGLAAPTVFTVDPRGEVSICWGLAIGNARRQSLGEIVGGYDPARNGIVSALLRGGPAALLELPAAAGFRVRPGYANVCELCREVVPYLTRAERVA